MNKIEKIIKVFRDRFGVDGLSDGNCGTFSLALCKILIESGIDCKLGFIYRETDPECISIRDVINADTDIFHVFIEVDNQKYDCVGKIDDDYLFKFSVREYDIESEDEIGMFNNINPDTEKDFFRLINNDTDWSISSDQFYNFYTRKSKIIKESLSGFPNNAYWFHEDFGMRIGIELRGDSSDKIRKSKANVAKEKWIVPWINTIKNRLLKLKYSPIDLDVVFTSKKTDEGLVKLGYAVIEDDGRYYFLINSDFLSGKLNIKSQSVIKTFIHEWCHIWLFINTNEDIDNILKNLYREIKDEAFLLDDNPDLNYAMTDPDGDELWVYMNLYIDYLPEKIKQIYWKIRELGNNNIKINKNNMLREIKNTFTEEERIERFFTTILKKNLKSHVNVSGKSTEEIQNWIEEKLDIPIVIDTETGKMETYVDSMRNETAIFNTDYDDIINFLSSMYLFGIIDRKRYLMISPEWIVEYIFGNSDKYVIPQWEV